MAKIRWQGREVEGVEVSFKTSREEWNEYELMDGALLRLKAVVSDIVRLEGEYDPEGNPIYVVKSGNFVVVKAPEHLKKK